MRRGERKPQFNRTDRFVQRAHRDAARIEANNRIEAEKRLEVERGLKPQRAAIAYNALGRNSLVRNSVGIVALSDSNPQYFLEGMEEIAKKDNGRVITFPASTKGKTGISHVMEEMTKLQLSDKESGLRVVVFEGADYHGHESAASEEVTEIISELAITSSLMDKLRLMVVGRGRLKNLPGSTQYDPACQPAFAENLGIMFALDEYNELSSAPETGSPTRLTTLKPFDPKNAARSNFPALPPSRLI